MKLSLLPFLAAINLVNASWKLHSSCKENDETETMVNDVISSAFSMASYGKTAVDNVIHQNDQSEQVNNILKWMFFKDGDDLDVGGLNSVSRTLNGLHAQRERNDDEDNGPDTIIVYCTEDRLKEDKNEKDETIYYDPDTDEIYDNPKKLLAECHDKGPTVAWAMAPENDDGANANKPSQVQICPFFFEWMKDQQTKTLHELRLDDFKGVDSDKRKSVFYQALAKSLEKHDWILAPIDVYALFDKVILHELTHTRPGGRTVDVDNGNKVVPDLLTVRYGWKRCRSLAQENPTELDKNGQTRKPGNNADSIALMACAVALLEDDSYPVTEITQEGKVITRNSDGN